MAKDSQSDEKLLKRAKDRFKRCQDWEANFRQLFVDDLRFAEADADNQFQWPDALRKNREVDSRPCLTINKTRQHNLQIINDAKQNKPSVTIRASGGTASKQSADIYEGVIRHIEYISNATDAYDTAAEFQVKGGVGYWRVVTDYANNESFDQDVFIRRVKDPMSVYLDPDIKEVDGSDARFGFVFQDLTMDEFEAKYPNIKNVRETAPLGAGSDWLDKDHVRVAEYYELVTEKDTLCALPMPDGSMRVEKLSALPADARKLVLSDDTIQKRDLETTRCQWYKIAGDQICERQDWPGVYIPIVRVIGEETIIEGQLERKGHTRALKDPQRMYNYWTSSAVEFVALQGKQPYIASVEQIEGLEDYWATANSVNHAYLPYNATREDGAPTGLGAPQRQQPPMMAQGYISGMQTAAEEMKMVSGQYDPTMGSNPQDQSGIALQAQQRKGDRATYHYIDGLAKGIRHTGKILIDLVPKVYDTPRIVRILALDGDEETIKIDPQQQAPVTEQQDPLTGQIQRIFNPAVGEYDVVASTGPAYQTQREASFNAMMQLANQNPQFMQLCGDLVFKAADFPLADEIAERMGRAVPPNIKGDAPPPEVQQMQQQLQAMQQAMQQLHAQLAQAQAEKEDKGADRAIDAYKAETERLKVLGPAIDPAQVAQLAAQMVMQTLQTPMPPTGMDQHPAQLMPPPGQPPQPDPQQMQQPQQPPQGGFSLPADQGQPGMPGQPDQQMQQPQ